MDSYFLLIVTALVLFTVTSLEKHVDGQKCDKCKQSFFNLQSDEPDGCVACFCFGVSRDCKCANYYKDKIRLRFALIEGPEFLRLSDLSRDFVISTDLQVQGDPQHFVYDKFDKKPAGTYYWFLGEEFRGDMITSYDGIMRYTVSHDMNPGGELTRETDVQIMGRGLILKYRSGRPLEGGKKGLYGLKLSENWLRFPDGSRVTRDNVMTVLSAVDSILIRATYSTTTTRASLYDVSLEKAVPQVTRYGKANNIEECSCPPEYAGASCQQCARGYTRSYPGPDFSPCVQCSCNQHSKECDPENGQCIRCNHFTTGPQCDRCSVGFYGDATKGTSKDCQPCPCPLTVASNQFSRLCKLEADGRPTCTACQTGYTGRNCERCAKGYTGHPSKRGEKCVKIPVGFLPTVRVWPVKRIKEEGKNAHFYCFAGGQQTPILAWSRESGEPMSRRVSIKGKRLLIRGVKKEDEGTYLCTARNTYGSEIAAGKLTVKDRLEDPIVVSVSPKVLHVPLNSSAQFTCKAKSITGYKLKWTRGMYGALPDGAVNVNGVLRIQNTQSVHGGTYTCTGKNSFSDDMATVQLRVGVTSPQVFISPTRLSVREGESAQFRCSASGFPPPVLQWHGGSGGVLPPEAVLSNGNGLLTFVEVKEIHEGAYVCTASNLGGIASTGTFLNVSASGSAPVISVSPSSLTVSEDEEALFLCTAKGDPSPTISWSRENGQLPQSSSLVNGLLRIFPAMPEDEGAYVCTAANSFGAKAFLVTLNVERDTSVVPTALVTPAQQTVDEGASTFLSCKVTGDPLPTIQWSKIGGNVTDNHMIDGGLLQIKEATKDDEGMYVCVAQNKKGVKQATGIVNVRSE